MPSRAPSAHTVLAELHAHVEDDRRIHAETNETLREVKTSVQKIETTIAGIGNKAWAAIIAVVVAIVGAAAMNYFQQESAKHAIAATGEQTARVLTKTQEDYHKEREQTDERLLNAVENLKK